MRRLFPTPAANDADTVANHDATPVPRDWARVALIAVCVFHAVSPLVLRGFHAGLGADERVYVSQINPHVPAGVFTAPRARGLTLLTAPASLVSSSIVVLRIWLAVLAGIGLYLGMLPWLRLRKGAVVPLAAALWSGLWLGTYYAFEAMPNPYVAYGALATSGWVLLAVRAPDRRRYVWYAAAAVAFTALIRPSDCAFLLLAVGASIVVVRGLALRRRLAVLGWLAGGFMAGLAEWLVEAYVRFGGPVQRFHAASAENTGGLHWSLGAQLHTLAGPLNCRGDCHPAPPVTDQIWWFALVPLVIWGLVAARRRRDTTIFGVATVAGLSLAAEYILAIDYAAPRFLIPAYALLALPVAEGLTEAVRARSPQWQPLAIGAIAVVLGVELISQTGITVKLSNQENANTNRNLFIASALHAAGVSGSCNVGGIRSLKSAVAYDDGCDDTLDVFGPPISSTTTTQVMITDQQLQCGEPWSRWNEYGIQDKSTAGLRIWIRPPRATMGLPTGTASAASFEQHAPAAASPVDLLYPLNTDDLLCQNQPVQPWTAPYGVPLSGTTQS